MPRVIASIEARMGSSRYPGKVLTDICGKPALGILIDRLKHCELIDGIIVATSVAPADDAIEHWCQKNNIACFRGSEDDVLQRVVEAHRMMCSEIIVEITGDCILIDPEIIDMGIKTFLHNDCDVVANVRDLSYPMGMDIQVFRFVDLEKVERTVRDPAVREHVSLYFYEHPELYRVLHLYAPRRWHGPEYRLQLDYPEDHRFLTEIYSRLALLHGDTFGLEEIMRLLQREPQLLEINRHCIEKSAR